MAPLDKYSPNKHAKEISSELGESQAKKPLEGKRSLDTQRYLERVKNNLKVQFQERRKETIRQAADKVKREFAENSHQKKEETDQYEDLQKKRHETRLEQYQDPSNADMAFDQIFLDLNLNKENFRSEKGWQYQYLYAFDANGKAPKDRMSLEAFVLDKQYAELENIWNTLTEVRLTSSIENIYPDLEGEQNKIRKADKIEEKKLKSQEFFKAKEGLLEIYFSSDLSPEVRQVKGQELSDAFKSEVFADLDFADPAQGKSKSAVDSLFAALLRDYENMINAKTGVTDLNTLMVEKLTKDDITEEEWLDALAKEAEKKAKKLQEEREKQQVQDNVTSSGTAATTTDLSILSYAEPIKAGEVLASDTKISIELVNPEEGTYKIKFPPDSGEGMETLFQARHIPEKNGEPAHDVFIFNDHLLPSPEVVEGGSLRREVNELYLRHVMGESVRQGKDYLGPDLGSIMTAQEINFIAGNLFYPGSPEKMNDISMTPEQAVIFKNLILLITNSGNNTLGNGRGVQPYGNLLALGNRIKLLTYAINPANGANNNRTTWFEYLKNPKASRINAPNLETFCSDVMKISPNNGNFTEEVK